MHLTRRNFLSLIPAGFLFNSNILKAYDRYYQPGAFVKQVTQEDEVQKLIFPTGLRADSKIAITAPASQTSSWEIVKTINVFERFGCEVEVGNTIKNRQPQFKYFSASDEERAAEFMEYIEREDIDCIISGRGGFGSMRILDLLDYEIIRKNPKIILGFSDITALLIAINRLSKITTFHGPVAVNRFNNYSIEYMKNILFYNKSFKPLKITTPKIQTINKGIAKGRLVGGNLTMVTSTLGTPYEINSEGALLFLEEVSEEPYKIDRMLTQLYLAGKLQCCVGIAFGYIQNLDRRRNFYPGASFTVRQVIESRLKSLEIPSVLGLPFGHTDDKITLPIGAMAELDATKRIFTILEQGVSI